MCDVRARRAACFGGVIDLRLNTSRDVAVGWGGRAPTLAHAPSTPQPLTFTSFDELYLLINFTSFDFNLNFKISEVQ